MVFESVISTILNKVLGDFIENLDTEQLNLGLWGGNVELKDLVIKHSALDDLELGIQAIYGRLGKFVLKVPWKDIYNQPTIINIEDIYLLAVPSQTIKYDAIKEEKRKYDYKKREIEKVEASKKAEAEKDKPKGTSGFSGVVERLIAHIIKNIQLTVKNIHIRYEDKITNPSNPFAVGVTLSTLTAESTDFNWKKAIVEDIEKIYKVIDLVGLAVYWNCKSKLYGDMKADELVKTMKSRIASKSFTPQLYHYVLGPINASARLRINQKPENDTAPYTIPIVHLNLDMEKLYVGISSTQFRDVMALIDSIALMSKSVIYLKYRPDVTVYKGNYKKWWKFAYTCILEEKIKRKKRDFSWNNILLYRNTCKEYKDLFSKIQRKEKMTPYHTRRVEECEKLLNITDIVIVRQQVELETERYFEEASKNSTWKSWLGWGNNPTSTNVKHKGSLMTEIQKELTPEEKKRLYKAIDYQENATPVTYPEEYVDKSLSFLLRSLEVELLDDENKKGSLKQILLNTLKGVNCKFQTREAASSISVNLKINSFNTIGMEQDSFIPPIITSETLSKGVGLLELLFETNPLTKDCDQRLNIKGQPLKIVYDAKTVNKITSFFTIPPDTDLGQITEVAADRISDMKEMTATGIQYTIDKHLLLDINIDFQAPYLILPYGGKYMGDENVLVLNLGRFKMYSKGHRSSVGDIQRMFKDGKTQSEILEYMMDNCYDNFTIELSNVQLLVAQSEENWLNAMKHGTFSEMHLLHPLSLSITLSKCLITDDPKLPFTKLSGKLPCIDILIQEARLLLVVAIITSFEFPGTEVSPVEQIGDSKVHASSLYLAYKDYQDHTRRNQTSKLSLTTDKFIQFTTLEANFQIGELSLALYEQSSITSPPLEMVTLKLKTLEMALTQQTFTTNLSLMLGSISCTHPRDDNIINIISTPFDDGLCLFNVKFTQVNPKNPEFHSVYNSCESILSLDFGILNIILHQEVLLELMVFANNVQQNVMPMLNEKINEIAVAKSHFHRDISVTRSRTSSVSLSHRSKSIVNVRKDKSHSVGVVESIKFKIVAQLQMVNIKFATDKSEISNVTIGGIKTSVIIKSTYTELHAKLLEISIINLDPATRYKKILEKTEDVALTVRLVLNNLESESVQPDIDVMVKGGGLRIFFLNAFLTAQLNFINQFQTAQQKFIEASQNAAYLAKENVKDAYAKATKVSLDIILKAPDIIIPTNSKSEQAILVDLGIITLLNKFITLDIQNPDGFSAVVDDLKVNMTDLQIKRIELDDTNNKIKEVNLLNPLSFFINIKRNLSSSWYTSIPDIDISGHIKLIKLLLSQNDYLTVMSILNGNLAEGQIQNAPVQSGPVSAKESAMTVTTHASVSKKSEAEAQTTEKPHIFLKFSFSMENFIINLYTMESEQNDWWTHNKNRRLARFSIQGLSLKGRILTDQSLVTSVLLVNCVLEDMRKGRENKLKRLLGRTNEFHDVVNESTSSDIVKKSMIDVTFQQSGADMFLDVRVYSITFILSMDYLMKIADFFKLEDVSVPNKNISVPKVNIKAKPEEPKPESQLTLNLKLEKPDIVLVEHMNNIDTNAMIVNTEMRIKLRMVGTHQVINGTLQDLQIYTCNYNPTVRSKTRCDILKPVTISVAGSTPENKGLHIELLITEVYISVSPGVIELLNRCMVTISGKADKEEGEAEEIVFHPNLWDPKPFADTDFWYLKTESGVEAINEPNLITQSTMTLPLEELCIIAIPLVTITVEAGVGTKTVPMLILETAFRGSAKNWSSQLAIEASLTMLMGYYNSRLALWEPLIEPIEEVDNEGNLQFSPWELKLELSTNQESESSITSPSEEAINLPPPLMCIDITSTNNLEVTISKTLLEVLTNLGKAFSAAIKAKELQESHTTGFVAPYRVRNDIGEDITLLLEDSSFQIAEGGSLEDINKSSYVPLQLIDDYRMTYDAVKLKRAFSDHNSFENYVLNIKINSKDCEISLPVVRADKRYFTLNFRDARCMDNWGIISDIQVDAGITTITLRSILQVYNNFNVAIDVYYMTPKGNELELIGVVQPNGILNIPLKAVYNPTNELFFAVSGFSVSSTPYTWKDLQTKLAVTKILQCTHKDTSKGKEPFIIKAIGEMEQVYFENTTRYTMISTCFNIHLRPAIIFKNFLPVEIVCCVDESPDEFTVKQGDTLQLPNVDPGKNVLVIRIPEYLEKEWSCRHEVVTEPQEFVVWTFHSYDSPTKMTLDLGMHTINKHGSLVMALYCPFWMLNKTEILLAYRSSDENLNILHHPAHFKGPILFSFNSKHFFGKKKASVRIENGEWSDKFSIDVAGSSGVVTCKANNQTYQIGIRNQLTYNGLTKQVTFAPYYVIINNAPFPIECQESDRPADQWITIESKSCMPLWPKSEKQDKLLRLRVASTDEISAPFLYTESHTTLLRLPNKYGGINVDVQITEGGIYINFAAYENGSAPALLINHTKTSIVYWEKDSVQKWVLKPKQKQLFTWENPSGPRVLAWDRGYKKEILNDLRKDIGGEFSPSEGLNICWASFLDGMQRVLLFTEDRNLAESAQVSTLMVAFDQEITIVINGLGISFVNNLIRQEVMYIGIASSGIIWETSKINGKRFKPLNPRESAHLEVAYQQYLLKGANGEESPEYQSSLVDNKIEVDYKNLLMLKPTKKKIRRTFQTGLWLQLKTSPTQMQLHAKVNRLQIDNQIFDCIFPVVLAPIPPPKSVAVDSGIKPFMEVSIVQLLMKNSQIRQFKYFKVLIQEFQIKVDLGFVNALLELIAESEQAEEEEKKLFLQDTSLVDEALYSVASSQSIQEQKSFYDLLHFSPLKIHVSFSLSSGGSTSGHVKTPNFLNVLLQGFGVTLTDLQDVVFKLAYFERNYTFLTQKELVSAATSHYVGQAVKQLYVLVLGLDVIGNPYGLVVGITKGVEDLFYEPIQGAIQGPGEFAEGLALGVKSLFGHTVGGAAGALSRMTGAMGKGIAALTFDEDFQRKRRDNLNRKPSTVQEGIARSGKGLVMGVVSGVTGVITKPFSGAKEEGVEGFFKGLGKGAVGLVARPVAGVVDFTSGTFDAVKRATDSEEEVARLRPPRFLQSDGLVRPYYRYEAQGNKFLNELSKGKYAKTDIYITHFEIIQGKEILLLTDQRLAYIIHNDIFGGWHVEWFYTWQDLVYPAKIVPKGVFIPTTDKKKKLFGPSENGKTILIGDPLQKEEICSKIEYYRCA